MNPPTHFLLPFVVGLFFSRVGIFDLNLALLAGFIGMFVDIDHYIEHILYAKKNRFSLRATWNDSAKLHRFYLRSFIHYGKGAVVVSVVLALLALFSWQLSLALAIGYYSHLLLDFLFDEHAARFILMIGPLHVEITHVEFFLDYVLIVIIIFFSL